MKKITYEQADKMERASGYTSCAVMFGYNAAVDTHNAKRDKLKRVDECEVLRTRIEQLELDIEELQKDQHNNLAAMDRMRLVIGEHSKDIAAIVKRVQLNADKCQSK